MSQIQVFDIHLGHYSSGVWHASANSAGGVSVKFSFKNKSEKTIKYARFTFTPLNRVNDAVKCLTRNISNNSVLYTGPLGPNETSCEMLFENAWYNNSIESATLDEIYIEYMDGTSKVLSKSEFNYSSSPTMTEDHAEEALQSAKRDYENALHQAQQIKEENTENFIGIIITIVIIAVFIGISFL